MGSKTLKRLISSVLSLSILCTQFVTMPVLAETNDTSLTESQIVMNHYAGELSEQETAIMNKWLNSETHVYVAPTDADELVTIENDKNVTAATYTKDGNEWVPVKAYLVENGVSTEITDFANGAGTISPATGTYSVEVDYAAYVTIPTDVQEMFMNATYWAAQGIEGLNVFATSGLSSVGYLTQDVGIKDEAGVSMNVIQLLYAYFVQGKEFANPFGGEPINFKLVDADSLDAAAAIERLYLDWADGGFDYINLAEEYKNSHLGVNEIEFISYGQANELYTAAEKIVTDVKIIYECSRNGQIRDLFTILDLMGSGNSEASAANTALRSVFNQLGSSAEDSISTTLTKGLSYDWTILGMPALVKETAEASSIIRSGNNYSLHTASTEKLLLATATVGAGVNSADVTYSIDVTVVENNTLVEKSFTGKIRLAKGLTMAEVDAVIENEVEKHITANWAAYNLNNNYYNVSWSYADYGTLNDNVTYEITYVPKEYTVSGVLAGSYPYGWKLTLPSGADEGLLYSYLVNGVKKNEKDIVLVDGNLEIVRNQQTLKRVLDIVAKFYGYASDSAEYAILTNKALASDGVSYNIPENAEELLTLKLENGAYVLTALTVPSGAQGMTWVPYGYYIDGTLIPFADETYTATINTTTLKSVNVEYRLEIQRTLDGKIVDAAYRLAAANLPYNLKADSNAQVAVMDALYSYLTSDEMADIVNVIPTGLKTLRTKIWEDYDFDEDGIPDDGTVYSEQDQKSLDSIATINSECFEGGNLKIKAGVESYKTIGLLAYYQENGYNLYLSQLNTLIEHLGNILEHPKFGALLVELGYGEYLDKVADVVDTLVSYRNDLVPPSSLIDINHPTAVDLFKVLSDKGVSFTETADKGLADTTVLTVNAEGVVGVNVVVTVNDINGGDPTVLKSEGSVVSLEVTETFSQADIDALNAEIERLIATLPQKDFVETTVSGMPTVGQAASAMTVSVVCDPITIPVKVNGTETGETVAYGKTTVTLPFHTVAGYTYNYTVMGKEMSSSLDSYALTSDELAAAFALGYVEVVRTEVNVGESNIVTFVDSLNSGLGAGNTKFVLVEDNGAYNVVLRVDMAEGEGLMSKLMGIAEAMAMGSYSYVAMGEDASEFVIWNGEQVSIQAMINGLLTCGLSFDRIIEMIDDNGNLINLNSSTVGDNVLVGTSSDLNNLGASLLVTDMYLGTASSTTYSLRRSGHQQVGLYVTLSGSGMKDIKDALTALKPYLDVNTDNSTLNMIINVPDRAYQVILAGMLLTGYADLDNVADVEFEAFVKYLEAQFDEAVLNPEVSADTYQNTLDELNASYSLAAHKETINKILKAVRKVNGALSNKNITNNSYSFTMNAHSNDVVSAMGLNDTYALLLKKEPLTADVMIKVENFGTAYEAVYFDNSKAGLDKVHFTKDFAAVAPNLGNNAIVILLGDVAGNVVLNNGIILDLNGKTMPSLKANAGTTKIFNSAFEADGGVTGSITGNFTIAGGKYGSDVSSMVVEGYTQTNGVVESDLYRAYMDGNKLVVELEVDFLDPARETDLKYFAIDLALQMGLEFYTASKLNVEGSDIYAFESTDLIDDFFGDTNIVNKALHILNYPGLTTFTNTVIDDLTNWGALAAAVESGNPLVSYDLTTTPWGVALTHVAAEDYMSVAVKGDSAVAKDYTLEIRVRGNASDDDNVYLAKLLREFEKVLTVDADVALNDLSYTNENGLTGDYFGNGEVVIDFTQADNGEDYTTLMGLILAYANPSMKTPVQNYINKGDVDGLIAAFDELTVANVISAIKSIRGVSFAKLSAGYNASEVAYLESIYHVFLQGTAGVLNKLEVTGNGAKLGALSTSKGVYEIEKSLGNISGKITLKLFAEKDPIVTPYAKVNADKILAWEIDYTNHVIKLDLAVTRTFNGLALDKFGDEFYLGFDVNNGVVLNTTFDNDTVAAGVLRNGSVVVVEYAKSATATPSTETWTIQIVGDVNCNGLIESNDAALIAKKFVDNSFTLNDAQAWAADVNGNGTLESNDALLNAYKWTLQTDKYTSKLRNVEEGK